MCLKKGGAIYWDKGSQLHTWMVLQDSDVGAGFDSFIVDYSEVGTSV